MRYIVLASLILVGCGGEEATQEEMLNFELQFCLAGDAVPTLQSEYNSGEIVYNIHCQTESEG